MQEILAHLSDTIRAAAAKKTPLCIRGGGSKDFYGGALRGEELAVNAYRGIIDYEPTELVITACAGTPLAEIEAALHRQGQMLAFEPPHFDQMPMTLPSPAGRRVGDEGAFECSSTFEDGVVLPSPVGGGIESDGAVVDGGGDKLSTTLSLAEPTNRMATLGGCIAAGLSGPRRAYAGAVRDFVLGIRMLDGKGSDLRFGGQVMKNVAGFDVSRLMAGSLGTLGVILEVSLKVLPLPVAETTLQFNKTAAEAITAFNEWAGRPLPISATAWHGNELRVRLSGAAAAVEAAIAKLGGEPMAAPSADAFWQGVREHTQPFFKASQPLWRLSLKSTAPPINLPGAQLIEWGGALRWLATDAAADAVRASAAAGGGHATLFRGGDKSAGVFHPLAPGLTAIHRKLKRTFDPHGIFNPGRLYEGE